MSEGVEGGFAGVYPVLRALEETGRIRRGYFVDGLGAAQFALAGAIDRLRAAREPDAGRPRVDLLAAADPAQPYGAALPWPRRGDDDRRPFQRAAGAHVVLVDGAAVLYVERGGKGLATFPAADDPERAGLALAALAGLLGEGPSGSWSWPASTARPSVRSIPGGPASSRPASCPATGACRSDRGGRGAARCPKATRSFGPPPGCGPTCSGGR